MLLTRHNLGLAVRVAVYQKYGNAEIAGKCIDINPPELRRAWGKGNQASRHLSMKRMIEYLDKMGYEVYFNVVEKAGSPRMPHQPAQTETQHG